MKTSATRQLCAIFLLALVSTVLSVGCASVPMAPKEKDTVAKSFTPNPEKAQIYLYRNESFGGAITMTVALDEKVAGRTGPKTFFW